MDGRGLRRVALPQIAVVGELAPLIVGPRSCGTAAGRRAARQRAELFRERGGDDDRCEARSANHLARGRTELFWCSVTLRRDDAHRAVEQPSSLSRQLSEQAYKATSADGRASKAAPTRQGRTAYVLFSNRSSRRRAVSQRPTQRFGAIKRCRGQQRGPAGASEPGGDAEAPLDAGSQHWAAQRRAGSAKTALQPIGHTTPWRRRTFL